MAVPVKLKLPRGFDCARMLNSGLRKSPPNVKLCLSWYQLARSGERVGTVAVEGAIRIREAVDAAGERQRGRAPVTWGNTVARDACRARDVLSVIKVRRHQRSQAAERESEIGEDVVIETVLPVDVGINAKNIVRI